jgi:hypothetical protein
MTCARTVQAVAAHANCHHYADLVEYFIGQIACKIGGLTVNIKASEHWRDARCVFFRISRAGLI